MQAEIGNRAGTYSTTAELGQALSEPALAVGNPVSLSGFGLGIL